MPPLSCRPFFFIAFLVIPVYAKNSPWLFDPLTCADPLHRLAAVRAAMAAAAHNVAWDPAAVSLIAVSKTMGLKLSCRFGGGSGRSVKTACREARPLLPEALS